MVAALDSDIFVLQGLEPISKRPTSCLQCYLGRLAQSTVHVLGELAQYVQSNLSKGLAGGL